MDSRLLYEKIERFEKALKEKRFSSDIARELVRDFKTWVFAYDDYLLDLEFDKLLVDIKNKELNDTIELFCKILIQLGRVDILTRMSIIDKDIFNNKVNELLDNRR